MRRGKKAGLLAIAFLGIAILGGCGASNASQGASQGASSGGSTQQSSGSTQPGPQTSKNSNEKPVAAEKNPVGDIPDTQAFVTYTSQHGKYSLEAPEGWARTVNGGDVSFVDKLDGMSVSLKNSSSAPTVDSVRKNDIPALKKSLRAVQVSNVQSANIPAGQTVLVKYTSNSKPDPVTGKQVRQENNNYIYYKNGKVATLRLYAPLGADNVDQWNRISQSFGWM